MHERTAQPTTTRWNDTSRTSVISRTSDRPARAQTLSDGAWNRALSDAPAATPFHRHEALAALADHAGVDLHPIAVVEDGDPVGLCPLFVKSFGPVTAVFSPAPNHKIHNLGPVLLSGDDSPVERERRRIRFARTLLSCIDKRFAPQYVLVRTAVRYEDPRPFVWDGFRATPRYTYVVDLTPDAETLLERFSSDARRNVRNRDESVTVREAGPDAIDPIIEQVRDRYEEQGKSYSVSPAFVRDCYEALPAGTVRPYVVETEGEFAGGMVTFESGDTVYRWQGAVRRDTNRPVNDLLDWRIMQDAADRGRTRYDLVGANNPRISRYKAKFGPDLASYHSMVRTSTPMRLLAAGYQRLR